VLDMDPYAEIMPYPGPVLIVHGTNDNIVHPDYTQRAYEAYSKRSGPEALALLEIIESGGHGFSRKHDVLTLEKLDCFMKD